MFLSFYSQRKVRKVEDVFSDYSSGWLTWTIELLLKKPIQWTVGTFVKKPLSWTFNKMFGSDDKNGPAIQYVHMDQLKVLHRFIERKMYNLCHVCVFNATCIFFTNCTRPYQTTSCKYILRR